MVWSLYEQIVDEMTQISREHEFVAEMSYCYMGEPFLSDDLDRYVGYALERGIEIYLNTNGTEMTSARIDRLLDRGFSGKIHISFHGITQQVFQRITGLDYTKTLANVHYLLKRYEPGRICIRGVDDNWPAGEKDKWFGYWSDYGVELEYLEPISRCGSVGRLSKKNNSTTDKMRLYGCRNHHPLITMVILFDGRAVMCCQDMGREIIWGDVGRDGISGVWNGPVRSKVVKKLYSGGAFGQDFLCCRCEQALGRGDMIQTLIQAAGRRIIPNRKKQTLCPAP